MKEQPFVYQDTRALHEKRMQERTRLVITQKNIEFILAHQNDPLPELARYLRQCKYELGHIPAQSEVIGGDLLDLRFGSWARALIYCGYMHDTRAAVRTLPLENTELFRAEYERQSQLHVQEKKERKRNAKLDRRERKSEKKREKKTAQTAGQ